MTAESSEGMLNRLAPLLHRSVFTLPSRVTDVEPWQLHLPFAFFLVHILRPRMIVELGTHKGDSYCALCEEVHALALETKCFAVDTWTGDPHSGFYDTDVLEDLRSHHDPRYGTFSTLLKMTFDEARPRFVEGTVDLLHIDGEHTFEAVRHDFESWLPTLSKRSVVMLHDTNERARDFGVWQLWDDISAKYPSFEFRYGHGLGIAAVGSEPEPRLLDFIDAANDAPSDATAFFLALGERAVASGPVRRLQAETQRLATEIETHRGELAAMRVAADEARIREAEERAALEARATALENELAREAEERGVLEAHATALEKELAAAHQSLSWKMTRPLRAFRSMLRGTKRLKRLIPLSVRRRVRERFPARAAPDYVLVDPVRVVTRASRPLHIRPLISIVMPTWNTDPSLLELAVASLASQTYSHWELCISDDGSTRPGTREKLNELAATDPRIHLQFASENRGISAASNDALQLASGEFVAFLDHDDELEPTALHEFVALLEERPGTDVIYSDEDKLDVDGRPCDAFFKPDWSPEYFRGVMYVGHLLMIRRRLIEEVGGFDPAFDGVQDYELMLRVSERGPHIEHLPLVLYHWRKTPESLASSSDAKPSIGLAQARAVQAHLDRTGIPAVAAPHDQLPHRVVLRPKSRSTWPSVSIVIPTRDASEHISRCLDSIYRITDYPRYQVVVVDTGTKENAALEAIRRHPVALVPFNAPFNFSRAINAGVVESSGDFVVLLNNDTEVIDADWLKTLTWQTELPGVGAVGPLLVYPDGAVQHAGVVLGFRGTADHVLRGASAGTDGYAGSLVATREVSGVTAACLMTRRSIFDEIGGLNEYFGTHYQDVDFCLQLRKRGLRILFTPHTTLIHHESASRGDSYDRLDRAILLDRWQSTIEQGDPYYNPNFSLDRIDYSAHAPVTTPW